MVFLLLSRLIKLAAPARVPLVAASKVLHAQIPQTASLREQEFFRSMTV